MSLNLDKSTWKRIAFGDAIASITDRVDNPSEAGVDRYVGLEHLDPGVMTVRRWDSPDKVEAQKLRFQPGDVIFGRRRAYQKKVAMAEFEGICSAHALVLRARPDYVDPDFLPVFLSSDYFLDRAVEISVGSLSPTINWRDLKAQEFDLPPLDEQKRIAELLWAVERHRRSVGTELASASMVLRRFLRQRFESVDGVLTRIVDLCLTVVGGVWGSPEGENEVDVLALGPRVYAGGATELTTDGSPVRSITQKQASSRLIVENDIILERSGGSPDQPVGRVVIAGTDLLPCIPTDFQRLLRPNGDLVEPRYLFWKLRLDWLDGLTKSYSKRTTNIANLSVPDYIARDFVVPTRQDQLELLADAQALESALSKLADEATAGDDLRSALLTEIFGGN